MEKNENSERENSINELSRKSDNNIITSELLENSTSDKSLENSSKINSGNFNSN